MTSCSELSAQLAALSADIAALDSKYAKKSDIAALENKYVTKVGFAIYKQYIENSFQGIRVGFDFVFKKLEKEKASYQEVFNLSDGLERVKAALDALRNRHANGDTSSLEAKISVLESKINAKIIKDNTQDTSISAAQREAQRVGGELWELRRDFNAFKLQTNGEHTVLRGAIFAVEKQVIGLAASIPAIVKSIALSVIASILFSAIAQAVAEYLAKNGLADLNAIRALALKALGDAQAAATLAVKAENKADIALSIARSALDEIKFVTARALAAFQRLEAFIKSEIALLTANTLAALLRLQSRIGSLEGVVNEINNVIKGLIGQVQTVNAKILDLQKYVIDQIGKITATVTDLKGIVKAIQAQFEALKVTVAAQIKALTATLTALKVALELGLKTIATSIEAIKADLLNQIKNIRIDIGKILGTLAGFAAQIAGILLTIAGINALIATFRPGGVINNFFTTNNNVTNVQNNVTNVQQISPQDTALLRRINATTTANLATSTSNNILGNAIKTTTSTILGFVAPIFAVVGTINTKMGALLPEGLSGWMLRFTQHQILDRAIGIITLAATIHNATQLSSNIGITLIQSMQNVLDFFGLKDSEGKGYDIATLVGGGINNFLTSVLGAENLAGIKKEWNKYNRIYQAAGNLFSSLSGMADSMTSALQVIGGQTGKIGNALRAWGVVSDKAYNWMNPTPNFSNPLLTKLNSLEETASIVENVSSQPQTVKSAKDELAASSAALADSLEQKPNAPQGKIIPEAAQIKTEQIAVIASSAGKDLVEEDLEPD
jgi:hypothetical protein